ncbi:hypothetical protein WDZ11_09530 [Roseomonas mucosa]|uniref:hypothetical protein n=1 Tax=Roseomonas mucosa TaxID=207340 RepID=UPI0030CE5732
MATGAATAVLGLVFGFVALGIPLLSWRRAGISAARGGVAAARGGVSLGVEISERAARRRARMERSGSRGFGEILSPFRNLGGLLSRQRQASPDLQHTC